MSLAGAIRIWDMGYGSESEEGLLLVEGWGVSVVRVHVWCGGAGGAKREEETR